MRCPNCSEIDHPGMAKFCHRCGTALVNVYPCEAPKTQSFSRFENAHRFSEGLAMVCIGEKAGFIDKTGNVIIPPNYNMLGGYMFNCDSDYGFYEGLAAVSVGQYPNVRYGCIDQAGNFVIQPQFECIWRFSEGLAPFSSGGRWGFIDKTGRVVVHPEYEYVSCFSEGFSAARIGWEKCVYIDKTGKIVFEKTKNLVPSWDEGFPMGRAKFSWAMNFHDGLARVECFGKYGYLDKTGRLKRVKATNIDDFSEGLAAFCIDGNTKPKHGYVDKNLKIVIEPQFEKAGEFHNGRAVVYMGKTAGFIDKTGRVVIPCQFDEAASFHEGLAAVKINKKIGFVDVSGIMVVPPRFDSARSFSEGLAAVEEHGKWGFIDKSGQYAF